MHGKKRKARRKPVRAGSGFVKNLLTMLVIVVIVVFGVTIFFKVEVIEVTGSGHYTNQEVIDASGIQLGDNMLLVNKSQSAGQLVTLLPYVEKVQISRRLPGTVVLELTECTPTALVVSEYGDAWLISQNGKLLEPVSDSEMEGYLQITGFEILLPTAGELLATQPETQEKLDAAMALVQALQATPLDPAVTRIDLTKLYGIVLYCGDRFQVELGGVTDLDYKLRYLQAAVAQLDESQCGVIDLTFQTEKIARFVPW